MTILRDEGIQVNILFTIILSILWVLFALGLLVTTFTNFQYMDLNILVVVAFFFAAVNTFLKLGKKT